MNKLRAISPGLGLSFVVAGAATFLSEHYSAPVMLYALLLGMALNFVTENEKAAVGIEFAAKPLLRWGVALLGLRIAWEQVAAIGWEPLAMVVAAVFITIGVSVLAARAWGFNPLFGFLSGGATAICGASAALALSAVLPAHPKKEQATLFTVVGVSIFSTFAMIAYPVVTRAFGLTDHQAGIFIGATIHDVAQVAGAGYAISPEAGDVGMIVKLVRVAMLLPVLAVAGLITRRQQSEGSGGPAPIPWFAVAFAGLVALNSTISLPHVVTQVGVEASRWFLVTAIAAIGMKTHLGQIVKLGIRPVGLMLAETLFLAGIVLAVVKSGLV